MSFLDSTDLVNFVKDLIKHFHKELDIPIDDLMRVFVQYHSNLYKDRTDDVCIVRKKKKAKALLEYIKIYDTEYLIDTTNSSVYSYNLRNPKYIGKYDVERDVIRLV